MDHVRRRMSAAHLALLFAASLLALAGPQPTTAYAGDTARGDTRTTQLVPDPGFERTDVKPCFRTSPGTGATVARSTDGALAGKRSVRAVLPEDSSTSCTHSFGSSDPEAILVDGALDLANDSAAGNVSVCLGVVLSTGGNGPSDCDTVTAGERRTIELEVGVGTEISGLRWIVSAEGRKAKVRLDDATLRLTTTVTGNCVRFTEPVPYGPPDVDSPCDETADPPASTYVPVGLNLPDTRPFIPLTDYTVAPDDDPVAVRFKQYVERAFDGEPDYGYSPADAVVLYARTGKAKYLSLAIKGVDRQVTAAEKAVRDGKLPFIAGDSYLEVGSEIESLALTYDWGYAELTGKQRLRWRQYGNQAIANVWSPHTASWGGQRLGKYRWSAWSINNPGNNYNFSFMQATQLWALATRQQPWIDFLQTYKFPLITAYYAQIEGGGSREGTGYGTAQTRLWANARTWAEATGEHLEVVEQHARDSVDYWIHATVPTLDIFAPFGDLSRESFPNLYDYQENLVREAAMAGPGSAQADRALWWIDHNSVPDTMNSSFNLRPALLRPVGEATKPTALVHEATGVGQLFARSAWQPDATWLAVIAGPYDESHAHMEQGAFSLYDDEWLTVTSNIWSHSGIQGGTDQEGDVGPGISSTLRFDQDGAGPVLQQNSINNLITSDQPGGLGVHLDLGSAYASSGGSVSGWERDLLFSEGHLFVEDICSVEPNITPVWQLHVPVRPTDEGGGVVTAGRLTLTFGPAYGVTLVKMRDVSDDFEQGWRIELTNAASCAFEVSLDVTP